ncbi:MAG TPA: zinc ribbon domain-containing protein [Candidatus Angelobacter sp.]|nr:zinc ribbon domain-containing protein [Candidatus Angelobacter sp.]
MICSFCGTENQAENRFCGMCGVRFERRQAERRVAQSGGQKCPSCGHANQAGHKFCGLCGNRVERRAQERRGAIAQVRATATANAKLPGPELAAVGHRASADHRSSTPMAAAQVSAKPALAQQRSRREPELSSERVHTTSIGGPSFLGLNEESSRNATYLLEDEQASRGGVRKVLLLLFLLAILGLIYFQWRSSQADGKVPEIPKADPATVPTPRGASRVPTPVPPAAAQSSAVAMQNTGTESPPEDRKEAALAGEKSAEEKSETEAPGKSAQKEPVADEPADSPATETAASPRSRPSAALLRAQQYLQGRGVRQNCEQGMLFLRAATEQDDASAAIQMGALYASGHCVRRDPVKAYQWFNVARQQQPENRRIEDNLNRMWAEMTPQERHRVQ